MFYLNIISITIMVSQVFLMVSADAGKIKGFCRVHFTGSSTLHKFDGTVTTQPFTANVPDRDVTVRDLDGVTIKTRVKDMDTGNKRMNRNMYEMFEAKDHPFITAAVVTSDGEGKGGTAKHEHGLAFDIKIRDIEKRIPAKVTETHRRPPRVEAQLRFSVSLKDFKLKPPTLFGILRVHDTVEVETRVILDLAPEKDQQKTAE